MEIKLQSGFPDNRYPINVYVDNVVWIVEIITFDSSPSEQILPATPVTSRIKLCV